MIDRTARSPRRSGGGGLPRAGRLVLVALGTAFAVWVATGVGAASRTTEAHGAPAGTMRGRALPPPAAELAPWTGEVNLYRDGVFTTQSSWLYCTAADIQIIRNMIEGTADHSAAAQTTYFDWMRTKNRYDLPLSAGIDPAGWTAGMQHFVDERYELVSSPSFGGTLRTAVTRMRLTGLPVALAVAHGNHGWVLHGFAASADPAATADFEITSVRVTGPLWGLQSRNGYDMPPDTTLTLAQLETFFTRWHYDPLPMIWDGSFVSIQPRAEVAQPTPGEPTATPAARPAAPPAAPTATPKPPPVRIPDPMASPTAEPRTGVVDPTDNGSGTSAPGRSDLDDPSPEALIDPAPGSLILVAVALLVVVAAGVGTFARRRRP